MDRRHLKRAYVSLLTAVLLVALLTACPSTQPPPTNRAPSAAAGSDQVVLMGDTVTLDAGASTDADGDELTYSWLIETLPSSSGAALSATDTSTTTFIPDVAGTFTISLSVSDGDASDSDQVIVTATDPNNDAPTISAIADLQAAPGEVVDVPFTITDEDPLTVTVTVSSSDTTLIADADLEVLGSGPARSLRVTLAQPGTGKAVITLVATDSGTLAVSEDFTMTVAQPFAAELPVLTASDAAAGDEFGYAVAMSGTFGIIGASLDDDEGTNSGSAYLFRRSDGGWAQSMKLPPKPPVVAPTAIGELNEFGSAVAMSSDYAIVGAPGNDDTTFEGAAYVFELCPGQFCQQPATEMGELLASDAGPGDAFGFAVAIGGEHALVGAIKSDGDGDESGSVYVFKRNGDTWGETAELTASDAGAFDFFGRSIAMTEDFAVIGSIGDDEGASGSGAAYIFQRSGDTWTETAKLKAGDAAANDLFGWSVAIDGDFVIVAAPNGNGGLGSAYVFQRTGADWLEMDELEGLDSEEDDDFGFAVALAAGYALVGAPHDTNDGVRSGSVYVFHLEGDSWNQVNKLTGNDAAAEASFGWSVALASDDALIGAPSSFGDGSDPGSAHAFERQPDP